MKKYFKIFTVLIVALLVSHSADAQWYMTGSANISHGYRTQSYYYSNTDTSYIREVRFKSHQWTLRPEVGYYLNPNMAVGCGLVFLASRNKTSGNGGYDERLSKIYNLGLSPYFRWNFVTTEHLSVGLRTMASVIWEHPGQEEDYKSNNVKMDLSLEPVLNYKFNEHWGALVYFGSIDLTHIMYKTSYTVHNNVDGSERYNENKYHTNGFNANLSLENWCLGVVYTF